MNEWPQRFKDAGHQRKALYAEYLDSAEWRARRTLALTQADKRCQVCNSPTSLHVHHRTYERVGEEAPGDLTALCHKCHQLFHGTLKLTRPKKRKKGAKSPMPLCRQCGERKTTKGVCKPCKRRWKTPQQKAQTHVDRFTAAMNAKWKPMKRIQEPKANRHPQRDGQVRPDPITANGGATASDESVATPEIEAASQRIASRTEDP